MRNIGVGTRRIRNSARRSVRQSVLCRVDGANDMVNERRDVE